jgi:purine-binding chemotaxis protein CheW
MTTELQEQPKGSVGRLAGKYLTFVLERQCYGIDVLKIREIIRMTDITAVPQMPAHVRGVINLREKIIPVIDLRRRFGFDEAAATEQTCIVVVLIHTPDGKSIQMGLVVDGVEEVVQIAASDIEAAPDFGAEISTDCLLGMAKLKTGVKTLLDIDHIIGGEKVARLASTAAMRAAS